MDMNVYTNTSDQASITRICLFYQTHNVLLACCILGSDQGEGGAGDDDGDGGGGELELVKHTRHL